SAGNLPLLRPAPRERRLRSGRAAHRSAARLGRRRLAAQQGRGRFSGALRHDDRRAGRDALGRAEAAHRDRPRGREGSPRADPGRRAFGGRHIHRGRDPPPPPRRHARANEHRRGAPHLDGEGRGRDPRPRRRADRGARLAPPAAGRERPVRADVPPPAPRGGARGGRGARGARQAREGRGRRGSAVRHTPATRRHRWRGRHLVGMHGGGIGGGGGRGVFDEDEILGKAYDARLMRRLLGYLRPYRGLVILGLGIILGLSVTEAAPPILAKFIVDNAIAPAVSGQIGVDEGLSRLAPLGIAYIAVLLVSSSLRYGQNMLASYVGQNAMYDLRVQLFAHQGASFKQFDDLNTDLLNANRGQIRAMSMFFPAVGFTRAATSAALFVAGAYWILQGQMTIGTLLAFWQLVDRFFQPIGDLAEKYNIMQAAMASSERVFRLLDTDATIVDPPHPRELPHVRGE